MEISDYTLPIADDFLPITDRPIYVSFRADVDLICRVYDSLTCVDILGRVTESFTGFHKDYSIYHYIIASFISYDNIYSMKH